MTRVDKRRVAKKRAIFIEQVAVGFCWSLMAVTVVGGMLTWAWAYGSMISL